MPVNTYIVKPCPHCRWYECYAAAQKDCDEQWKDIRRLTEQIERLQEENERLKRLLQNCK